MDFIIIMVTSMENVFKQGSKISVTQYKMYNDGQTISMSVKVLNILMLFHILYCRCGALAMEIALHRG